MNHVLFLFYNKVLTIVYDIHYNDNETMIKFTVVIVKGGE